VWIFGVSTPGVLHDMSAGEFCEFSRGDEVGGLLVAGR